jgi:PleD family two-component response regulator
VSVGVASGAVGDRVVKDADAALFEAKSSGRNRVAVH